MSFRIFILGLVAVFGLPWLLMVVIPFAKMRSVEPVYFDEKLDDRVGVYQPKRAGRVANGSEVYGANGCYVCHTQVIRPTYAGSDLWRENWAGQKKNADDKDTRRESNIYDYAGETFAHIGLMRVGSDLSNVGHRIDRYAKELGMSPEDWVYKHLLNPRGVTGEHWSTCASQPQLFKSVGDAVRLTEKYAVGEKLFVPKKEARALASYLLSLKKDDVIPFNLNYSRDKKPAS